MRFQETLSYLYERLPMFQRVGAPALKKDLRNTLALCEALGNPQDSFKSLHIAGTNGKGSVASMLSSILMESGYKTGLYTSPHLVSFTERIRVGGQEVSEAAVVDFVARHQSLIERIQPSFFELTVAMAFAYFAEQEVDIAVIEVGLGGRLDSTNIIQPELCVITHIGLDHQAMLGDSLEAIAAEKAGIMKPGIPVVISETRKETQDVFREKATQAGAPLTFADQQLTIERISGNWQEQKFLVKEAEGFATYSIDLSGHYQANNLRAVLMAVHLLRGLGWILPGSDLQRALTRVRSNSGLRGRMEVLREDPLVLADTAHNESGIKTVFAQLAPLPRTSFHILWGMVTDKDHDQILQLLPKEAIYYFVKPEVPRGLDAQALQELASQHQLKGKAFYSVQEGFKALLATAGKGSLGFVGGSTFVVAELWT